MMLEKWTSIMIGLGRFRVRTFRDSVFSDLKDYCFDLINSPIEGTMKNRTFFLFPLTMAIGITLARCPAPARDFSKSIGLRSDGYFIDVPQGSISNFFRWTQDFPLIAAAHRGGGFLPGWPENAIPTMENSVRYAPSIMEIDIQRSSDGVLLLMHDDTLNRTTTGTGRVVDSTWQDIQKLQLVDNFGTVTSYRVPSLRETLEFGNDRVLFALDLKADEAVEDVVDLITEMDAEDDVFFFADSVEQMVLVHERNANIHFALYMTSETRATLVEQVSVSPVPLERLTAFTVAPQADPAYNDALHSMGIVSIFGAFIPEYGLNSSDAIAVYHDLMANGVDSISTNRIPDLAAALGYAQL